MMRQLIVILTLSLFACGAMAGTWKLMSGDKACLLADMDLAFTADYTGTNTTSEKAKFDLPGNATVDPARSSCGETEANMTLDFYDGYSMLFRFAVLGKSFVLNHIEFHYTQDPTRFPHANEPDKPMKKIGDSIMFETPVGSSYRCNSMETDTTVSGLVLDYSNVKLQPFGVDTNGSFSKEHVCAGDLALTTTAQPTTPTNMTTVQPTTKPENMTTVVITTIIDNTTTAMATTLLPTTPKPSTEGNWTVKSDNNETCMNMAFKANFSFVYVDANNKSVSLNVTLPTDADPSMSSCSQNSSTFVLEFNPLNSTSVWMMTMVFDLINIKNFTKTKDNYNAFQMTELNVTYYDPMDEEEDVSAKGSFFETNLNKTYKCDAGETIQAGNMNVTFADVKFQPFAKGSKYPGELQDCKMDDKSNSNIVPIAVGCALAGLVVIVLIAYLIGRKRTKSVGYQTV